MTVQTKKADVYFCGVNQKRITEANPVLDMTNLRHLYNFIHRRYIIHLRKDVLKRDPPWINDPILREYRFTNVRREHDRETRWLIKHITSNPDLSYSDKILNVILFRLFNKHETSELINMPIQFSESWDPKVYQHLFKEALKTDSHRIFFTGAFITGGLKRALKWYLPTDIPDASSEMRVMYFMRHLLDSSLLDDIKSSKDQKEVFKHLSSSMGIGPFLGYQMFVDLTYIEEFPFSENEFTIAGPGCKNGLNFLFKDKGGMSYEECLFWVRDNIEREFEEHLGKSLDPHRLFADLPEEDRCLNVMSLENCFCELSKYIRAITDTGRPRKKYKQNKEEI